MGTTSEVAHESEGKGFEEHGIDLLREGSDGLCQWGRTPFDERWLRLRQPTERSPGGDMRRERKSTPALITVMALAIACGGGGGGGGASPTVRLQGWM